MTISKPTHRIAMWMLMAGLVVSTSGCALFSTIAYITVPNDVPAEYEGLKKQRVVVIVEDVGGLGYQDAAVPTDLARIVSSHLRKRVKKIDLVSQDEVNDWIDSNDVHLKDLGKHMKADKVVSIQLNHFRLNKGPNLYQGQAEVTVQILDVETGDIDDLEPLEALYPRHSGIPLDQSEPTFRRRFVNILAKQISRRFYAHESMDVSKDRLYPSDQ